MANLTDIYDPIKDDLKNVDDLIRASFEKSENKSIVNMGRFLLETPGKRIRPALAILSAKSIEQGSSGDKLAKIASAIELVHMASLLHDDVIDHSYLRHSKPTINSKWGKDVAITLGDYLYSVAFELISECGNSDIVRCMTSAAKEMCEGELMQV